MRCRPALLTLSLSLLACTAPVDDVPVCGNGVVEADEQCDVPDAVGTACLYGEQSCVRCIDCAIVAGTTSWCGDGVVDATNGEDCDGTQFCTDACVIDRPILCGDGRVEGDETCDDGNVVTETCAYGQATCEVCASVCRLATVRGAYCGDGRVEDGREECDDGNTDVEDCPYDESCEVCGADCTWTRGLRSYCGDGVVQVAAGEACDRADVPDRSCARLGYDATDDVGCYDECSLDVEGCFTGGVPVVQEFEGRDASATRGAGVGGELSMHVNGLAAFAYAYVGADNVRTVRLASESARGVWTYERVADDVDEYTPVSLWLPEIRVAFTRDAGDGDRELFVAHRDGAGDWVERSVATGRIGGIAVAVDASRTYVAYVRRSGSLRGRLAVAEEQPDGSFVEVLVTDYEKVASGVSMAIDQAGAPVVAFFHEDFYPYLKVARRAPDGTWPVRTVDRDGGPKGDPTIVRAPTGELFVGYHEYTVRFARDGGADRWTVFERDPTGGWEDDVVVAFTPNGTMVHTWEWAGEIFLSRPRGRGFADTRIMRRRAGTRFMSNRGMRVRPSGEVVMLFYSESDGRFIIASDPAR